MQYYSERIKKLLKYATTANLMLQVNLQNKFLNDNDAII